MKINGAAVNLQQYYTNTMAVYSVASSVRFSMLLLRHHTRTIAKHTHTHTYSIMIIIIIILCIKWLDFRNSKMQIYIERENAFQFHSRFVFLARK